MRFISRSGLAALVAVCATSALGVSPAFASGEPPFVETKAATGIVETGAELNGLVLSEGETKYHFEYGTTTSYGKSTPEVKLGSALEDVSQQIAGLAAGTAYDFRIVAKNSSGTTDGKNATFTTLKTEALPYLNPAPTTKGIAFKSKEGTGDIVYEFEQEIACTGSSVSGEFVTGKTFANTVITLSGCKDMGGTEPNSCGNVSEEEIKSEPLTGRLGYINKASKTVGLMFGKEYKGEKANERPVWAANVNCYKSGEEALSGPVRGELIADITPVNTAVKSSSYFTLDANVASPIREFEGGIEGQETKLFATSGEYRFPIGLNIKLGFPEHESPMEIVA